jgi:hypothetical protein
MTYQEPFKSTGNRRLWVVLSLSWILIAGIAFWKPWPSYQPVDVSLDANDECQAEMSADAEAAYENCIKKPPSEVNPTDSFQAEIEKAKRESVCDTARSQAIYTSRAKHEFTCMLTKSASLAAIQQPIADRGVDDERLKLIARWLGIMFLPPLLFPLLGLMVLRVLRWVSAGYHAD